MGRQPGTLGLWGHGEGPQCQTESPARVGRGPRAVTQWGWGSQHTQAEDWGTGGSQRAETPWERLFRARTTAQPCQCCATPHPGTATQQQGRGGGGDRVTPRGPGSLLESHLHSPALGPSQEAHRDAPRVEPPSLQEPALPQGPVITEAMRELLVMEAGLPKEMGPPAPWCQQDTQVPPGCTPALTVPRSIPAQQHHHTAAPPTSTCTHSMDNSRARCHPSQGSPGARWRSPPRRGPVLPNRGVRRGGVVP